MLKQCHLSDLEKYLELYMCAGKMGKFVLELPFSRYFLASVPSAVSFFNAQLLEHVFPRISTSNGPSSHLMRFINQKLHNWLLMLKMMPFQLHGWNRKVCERGSEMPRGPDCNPSLIALAVVQKPGRCGRYPKFNPVLRPRTILRWYLYTEWFFQITFCHMYVWQQ